MLRQVEPLKLTFWRIGIALFLAVLAGSAAFWQTEASYAIGLTESEAQVADIALIVCFVVAVFGWIRLLRLWQRPVLLLAIVAVSGILSFLFWFWSSLASDLFVESPHQKVAWDNSYLIEFAVTSALTTTTFSAFVASAGVMLLHRRIRPWVPIILSLCAILFTFNCLVWVIGANWVRDLLH